ncbi:MAG: hypothetical protein Q7V05_13050 [Methanoregula sp.]|nr:hypothetical protein [Methanoregula sp.]
MVFSPLTSAGTIRVRGELYQLYNITINITITDDSITDGRLVNFSYQPVGDFWLDQGYAWHYGYVNVTKGTSPSGADGAALSTPLSYATMNDVKNSGTIRKFAASLIDADSRLWYNSSANVSHITLSSVTFRPEPGATYVSGNGIGTFALAATVNETTYGIPETASPGAITVYVNRVAPDSFPLGLYNRCNQSFANLNATYPYNIEHTFASEPEYEMTRLAPKLGSLPFAVSYRNVAVNVSVQ